MALLKRSLPPLELHELPIAYDLTSLLLLMQKQETMMLLLLHTMILPPLGAAIRALEHSSHFSQILKPLLSP
jgi:hypothetical protein